MLRHVIVRIFSLPFFSLIPSLSKVFGRHIDLHSGGIDLAFPHHENEIAQCSACFNSDDWCGAFMHFGHLAVHGQKMSKSLKNFTTIRDLLQRHVSGDPLSSRVFRLFCLFAPYRAPVELTEARLTQAASSDRRIHAFLNAPLQPDGLPSDAPETADFSRECASRDNYMAIFN